MQDPDPDWRIRIIQAHPDEFVLLETKNDRQVSGFAFALNFLNGPVKNPRVAGT